MNVRSCWRYETFFLPFPPLRTALQVPQRHWSTAPLPAAPPFPSPGTRAPPATAPACGRGTARRALLHSQALGPAGAVGVPRPVNGHTRAGGCGAGGSDLQNKRTTRGPRWAYHMVKASGRFGHSFLRRDPCSLTARVTALVPRDRFPFHHRTLRPHLHALAPPPPPHPQ